jgi:polysaccharide pyruvyl transferase WcaK-like protein
VIIEIRKAGFRNKGAELMLLAIVARLRAAYPDAMLTMIPSVPNGSEPFARVTALGLYPKASLRRLGIEWGGLAHLIPKRLRRRYGLILDREVDVVLDAAGFAYSDQWGLESSQELARLTRRWRHHGTKVILMPQAFGPFSNNEIRQAIRIAVDNSDLVMPRDSSSFRYLTEVTGERDDVRQFPDFTNLIEGDLADGYEPEKFAVAIVPNVRMIDKTEAAASAAYLSFMTRCAERLQQLGARPYLLVHEGVDDERLATRIAESVGDISIVQESDALRIKGIIGASHAVVASRYHALISALSQGVPAVATGWSHKYNELFEDYGFPEGVLSVDDDAAHIDAILAKLVNADTNSEFAAQLELRSANIKARSEEMWVAVQSVIDS